MNSRLSDVPAAIRLSRATLRNIHENLFWAFLYNTIGIPLAVSAKKSLIVPTASMTVHPVRMTGLVVGAPQTYQYFNQIQEQIVNFVTKNSHISREDFLRYMMATDEIATDVGTVLYGEEAVSSGLMDAIGSLSDALSLLHRQIDRRRKREKSQNQ